MASRGVLYIVWSNYNKHELEQSIASLRPFGYNYHVAEIEDEGIGLAHKARMAKLSPFDITLFLDTDTVVKDTLDYGFDMAERYGIACCMAPASSAHLAGRQVSMDLDRDLPQLNTGVIFFDKSQVDELMLEWDYLCEQYPKSSTNDQPAFSEAVYQWINPYILPRTWNYRAKIRYEARVTHGPIKILHSR